MDPVVITKSQARRFLLAHQGLLPPRALRGEAGVLAFIRRVNCVQFDPINVLAQNPHLVLQARMRDYRPALLDRLLYRDRRLVDGFDKQMSIYPAEDWPDFAGYREQHAAAYRESPECAAALPLLERVRAEIRARGPLSAREIEDDTRMDWWLSGSVRAVRIALDLLFYRGELVVHHRVGTRRYFDLAERVLPAARRAKREPPASPDAYLEWHVFRRVGGIGLIDLKVGAEFGGTIGWRGGRIRAAILQLVAQGRLVPVTVAELPRQRFFVRREDVPTLEAASTTPLAKPRAALIAPLDNLIWDLALIRALFDFSYAWEVYKPAEKRRHGYYVLPVLYGDRFVARMDSAHERETGTLVVKGWWWEDGVATDDPAREAALRACFHAFARSLGARRVALDAPVAADPTVVRALGPLHALER